MDEIKHINRFKLKKSLIRRTIKYIQHRRGDKPKLLNHSPELWTTNGKHLMYDGKILVPRESRHEVFLKFYYDEDMPYSRDGLYREIQSKYLGISRPFVQSMLRKVGYSDKYDYKSIKEEEDNNNIQNDNKVENQVEEQEV